MSTICLYCGSNHLYHKDGCPHDQFELEETAIVDVLNELTVALHVSQTPYDELTEEQIKLAFDDKFDCPEGTFRAAWEHGQWWVTFDDTTKEVEDPDSQSTYSVVEANTPSGLDFEEV